MKKQGFDTLQLHAGQTVDSDTKSRAVPIYQTTAYVFDDVEHAEALFALKQEGNIYTRIMNPTTDVFEKRMAALENGVGALALASGASAIVCILMNLAFAGDNIISSNTVYGGTHNLFAQSLPHYGIAVNFVDYDDYDAYERMIDDRTRGIFVEALDNPHGNVVDFERLADIAHRHNIPFIVDNTFGTPYLIQLTEHGADIIVHSATKFIGGHSVAMGGVIVDLGTFDWKASGKFPQFTEPDPSYHGVSYTESFGKAAFIARARTQMLRDFGACISPFNSFLLLLGCETLSLRIERHVQNAQKIAEFLNGQAKIDKVNYPTLKGNKNYDLAQKYFPKGAGAVFTFELKGGKEDAKRFCDYLNLFSYVANVADAKSLVIHPATTTHSQMSAKALKEVYITDSTIRLSIGLEDAEDLIEDLRQALERL